jgi:hypothetical protein
MNDDVIDDVQKMSLIVDVSCVDWMMKGIGCMSSITLYDTTVF